MTNTITIEMVKEMDRKGLQATAKQFGIKANQKSEVIVMELTKVLAVQEVEVDEFEQFANGDIELEGAASEASSNAPVVEEQEQQASEPASERPQCIKTFEFIRGNNLGVVFMQKGVQVKIGWNPNDAKTYIKVGDGPLKNMSIQSAIDKFKKFKNGVHGDVARIVKALVRIRKMPAPVLIAMRKRKEEQRAERAALQNNQRTQENVSPEVRKENPSKARYSGTVDASWLAEFRHEFNELHDRQPTGNEIKDAWLNRGA